MRLGGGRIGGLDLAGGGDQQFGRRRQQAIEPLADLGFRQHADEHVDQLSVAQPVDGRNRLHSELLGDLRQAFGFGLYQQEFAGVFDRQLLQDRAQHPARLTPGSPEIDDNQQLARAVDDVGLERVGTGVKNPGRGHGGRGEGEGGRRKDEG